MACIGNTNIAFLDLSSGNDISETSPNTWIIDYEILDVVLLAEKHHPIYFIEIINNFNSTGSSECRV